ncbi:hypothetical protein MMC34_000585 [Xylographa carneopallida]|nr:hypothetical protein [Xylographa carneopallida]
MSTPFPTLLPPPGPSVLTHPLPPSTTAPDPAIPLAFSEALSVRIAVYVDEQHCRLSTEIDADDPRSWHWIVYASVSGPKSNTNNNTSGSTSDFSNVPPSQPQDAAQASEQRRPSGVKLPVATLRLVPPPHAPHPKPGSVDGEGGAWPVSHNEELPSSYDVPTAVHDGHEPYVKFGRLATLQEYRGLGLGKLLVVTALEWAARNVEALQGEGGGVGLEGEGVAREREGVVRGEGWKGLVLVHAQKGVEPFWRGVGFERDEGLGEWMEEGIAHVGMWRRVELEGV